MADDLPVEDMKVSDESEYLRGGNTRRVRIYRFFLGAHGPFVERVPLEGFNEYEIQQRVDALRRHLRDQLPK